MTKLTSLLLCLGAAGCVVGEVGGTTGPGTGTGTGGGDGTGTGNGNGNGNGNGAGGATATQFVTQIGHQDCDEAFLCKASFPPDAGVTFEQAFGATATACYASANTYFNPTAIEAAITKGTLDFDATAATACLAGLAAPACAAYWTNGLTFPAACDTVMLGKVADGAACTIDFECATAGSVCNPTALTCGAQAAPPP